MNPVINIEKWFASVCDFVCLASTGRMAEVKAEKELDACLAQLFVHNATLWGYEDEVRRTDITDAEIARYKRLIDRENQLRNDHIDKTDGILRRVAEEQLGDFDENLPLNTETPGSVFDRLTILALRQYHLGKEIDRNDAQEGHIQKCRAKLVEVKDRIGDLLGSLDELLSDVFSGKKRLKSYGTHKLYNDPETNPAVRNAGKAANDANGKENRE